MMLQAEKVSRTFGGLRAVKDVSFQLAEGEILGLIGPNGAGKTTLFNCINGVYPPTAGSVIFRGQRITDLPTYKVAHLGLARTHQVVRPLNELTVRENVMVGACFGRFQHPKKQAQRVADEVMEMLGLAVRAGQLASSLNIAQKKRLELARALAAEPYLLLLDEVLAGLNPSEIRDTVPLIRAICDRGVTVVMIEHVMQAVMSLAEQVFVLAEGKIIAEGSPERIAREPRVVEAYLGHGAAGRLLAAGAAHG
jgi:branched-chain amino acid transport system ATP-binding protein